MKDEKTTEGDDKQEAEKGEEIPDDPETKAEKKRRKSESGEGRKVYVICLHRELDENRLKAIVVYLGKVRFEYT